MCFCAEISIYLVLAGTWHKYNVASTSMQRHDVASTLRRRYIYVMCPLGTPSKYQLHVLYENVSYDWYREKMILQFQIQAILGHIEFHSGSNRQGIDIL